MRLSESKLHRIVRDTVRGVLREGTTNNVIASQWDEMEEWLGSHEMCDAIFHALNEDAIIDILEYLSRTYDIGFDDEDIEQKFVESFTYINDSEDVINEENLLALLFHSIFGNDIHVVPVNYREGEK